MTATDTLLPGHVGPGTHASRARQQGTDGQRQAMPAPEPTESAPAAGADPVAPYRFLASYAQTVTELEKARIAAENRLRAAVREAEDKDGITRPPLIACPPGFDPADKDLVRKLVKAAEAAVRKPPGWDVFAWTQARIVVDLLATEHFAELELRRQMRKHPLWAWAESVPGAGEKQVARLLGAIGNPAWRPQIVRDDGTIELTRPRRLSELRSYAGHGDPARRRRKGMARADAQALGSDEAKMRLWLVACSLIKQDHGPYRAVYEQARERYRDRVHAEPCVRCGPKGKPAEAGSPWNLGHQHAAAIRNTGKAFLDDLWRAAQAVHAE